MARREWHVRVAWIVMALVMSVPGVVLGLMSGGVGL